MKLNLNFTFAVVKKTPIAKQLGVDGPDVRVIQIFENGSARRPTPYDPEKVKQLEQKGIPVVESSEIREGTEEERAIMGEWEL